jgi:ribonuclease T2
MKRTSAPVALLALISVIVGWTLLGSSSHHRAQHLQGKPGAFDYYVLALSWSPEFCHSHPSNAECAAHHGFVVHGLWPQYVDGYPEHCSTQAGPSNPAGVTDIMPDVSLVEHEWSTHGTCSALDPDSYFKLMREAFQSLKIPPQLAGRQHMFSMTPGQVKDEFIRPNPHLREENLVVSCGNNYLTGINVCLSKQLQPRACEGLRDCRANTIRIPPIR